MTFAPTATRFPSADAERDGDDRAEDGGGRIEPEVLEIPADDGGCQRAGWIHGSSANRPGEHGFQGYHRTDGNARSDAFFLRAGGDAEDNQHEDGGEYDFQDEALGNSVCGQSCSQCGAGGKEDFQQSAGGKCSTQLASDVARDFLEGKATRDREADRNGRIEMRAADIAEGIDHREDDESED